MNTCKLVRSEFKSFQINMKYLSYNFHFWGRKTYQSSRGGHFLVMVRPGILSPCENSNLYGFIGLTPDLRPLSEEMYSFVPNASYVFHLAS